MNGILQKWLLIFLLIPFLILLFFNRVEGLEGRQTEYSSAWLVSNVSCPWVHAGKGITIPRADVFHNRKGLKNDIEVIEPLREMNAIARSDKETIEELIEDIAIWVPKVYFQHFLVQPECIIILESWINAEGRAEVRFGVAMECAYRARLAEPLSI